MKIRKLWKKVIVVVLTVLMMTNILHVSAASMETGKIETDLTTILPQTIKADYLLMLNNPDLELSDIIMRYYGTYSGCEIVWMSVEGQMDTTDMAEIRIGRYVFKFNSGTASKRFYAYKDHAFTPVKDAYEAGMITNADVELLAEEFQNVVRIACIYKDVSESDWAYTYVDDVYTKGLMTGLDSDTFGQYEPLSRAQFATILYRMEDSPEVTATAAFNDVGENEWYTEAVQWAYENEIVSGYGNDTFGPADAISREQMAVMMYRYAAYKGLDVTGSVELTAFPDGGTVSEYAKDAVAWSVASGIISGDNGKLNPNSDTSRAVCATIISRYTSVY